MQNDTIIVLDSGTEISVEAACGDLQRVARYLVQIADDDAQGFAADLNTATDLLNHLASLVRNA